MAHKSPMLHSIYDLTTFCRATTGDVPARLVGASTTVVGSKMYLFGGRLVTERRMVSDLYVFDLETYVWERIAPFPEDDIPRARYFHSTDAWNNHLIVFGGMSNQPDSINPDELCVLNDVHFFNIATKHWLPSPPLPSSEVDPLVPRARYAHLSSVTADRLFIIGGQDFFNTWLDDVCIFDLASQAWVQRRDYPRHCGTYRSVAVSSPTTVRAPQEELQASLPSSNLGPAGTRFRPVKYDPAREPPDVTSPEKFIHLPYSSEPTEDHPSDIYLYSNYNFTDVKRELEVFSPLPEADFTIQDRSAAMSGSTFPPGLRFPTGAILGSHLIIAGTYLAHSYQSFSIWVLDLTAMTWSRIDPGKAIETGSWFRGCLWAEANRFMIFGNRFGNLVDDYNRRLLSWDHVAVVDLEAFGIYQPPPLKLDIHMQELGLAALEERVLPDFEIICDDGQRILCSRKILEERWPWFQEQRKQFLKKAQQTLEKLPSSTMHVPLPDLPGKIIRASDNFRIDPRLTPRSFHLSEPYPVALALAQYFYTLALITPLQHTPGVLSQLLILATNYRIVHLESLVKHAMHRALSNPTSVGVYEVATLCSCRSLQIRALKTVMSYTQKRPSRRSDKEGGGNARPPPDNAGDGGNGSSGPSSKYVARPRGTSDAKWRTMDNGASSSGYNSRSNEASILDGKDTVDAGIGSNVNVLANLPAPNPLSTLPAVLPSQAKLTPSNLAAGDPIQQPSATIPPTRTEHSILQSRDSSPPTRGANPQRVSASLSRSGTLQNRKPSPNILLPPPPGPPPASPIQIPQSHPEPSTLLLSVPTHRPLVPSTDVLGRGLPMSGKAADPGPKASHHHVRGGSSDAPAADQQSKPSPERFPTDIPSRHIPLTTTKAVPLVGRLPRRPTTADPVTGRGSSTRPLKSSEDIRGVLLSRSRPSTATHTKQASLGQQPESSPLNRSRQLHTLHSNSNSISKTPSVTSHTAATVSPSMTAFSSDSPSTLATPNTDGSTFRSSQVTVVDMYMGGEYEQTRDIGVGKVVIASEFRGREKDRSTNWPQEASNIRSNGFAPIPSPVSPKASTSSSSTSSAFSRFLGRKEKPKESLAAGDDGSNLGHQGVAGPNPTAALAQIKTQIAELEEERKRLKKEAKLRALLTQTGGPISLVGGMAM